MRFRLLGPLEVQVGDEPLRIAADKQRTILAMLLARAGHVVPVSSLVTEVWGDRPPRSAVPNVRTYAMRLRRSSDSISERLLTSSSGYAFRVEPSEFDLWRFEAAAELGRKAMAAGDFSTASDAFGRALAEWRGTAAEDVPLGLVLGDLVIGLSEQYMRTVEEHAEAGLALGDHEAVAGRLRGFIGRHPLRERAYGQLMLAQYRLGDIPGALATFKRARETLVGELGVEPGPELSRLQMAILNRDSELAAPPPPIAVSARPAPPRQLPPAPEIFVGRTAELEHVSARLREGRSPRVMAVHGAGGIGKSAFALRVAHDVADHYPDGQLYVDLQGASPGLRPMRTDEILGRFLCALGVSRDGLPASEAEAAAMFQSLVAERRLLIVLDSAADALQVKPLLPAERRCAVLVTSRPILATLEAEQIALDVLDEAESARLLALQAGQQRVAAEPEAAGELVRWCGGHPLAVRIVGARVAARPGLSFTRLGERLRRRRLEELRSDDWNLRACFSVSFELLPGDTEAARAFRLLGTLRVPDVGVDLVAALLAVDPATADTALDELVAVRLLEPVTDGRYRMHDLIRLYAAELAATDPAEERSRALGRAFDWYRDTCHVMVEAIGATYRRSDDRDPAASTHDLAQAVNWLDTELPGLIAATIQAAETRPGLSTEMLSLVRPVAVKRGYWRELETLARLALATTRQRGDWAGELAVLPVMATIDWRAGRPEAARVAFLRGLRIARTHGDREGEARARHGLGWLSLRADDPSTALDHVSEALRLLSDRESAITITFRHNHGEILLRLGRYAEAAARFEQCLASRRRHCDRLGEGVTLAGLGRAYCLLDQPEQALVALEEAIGICRETGNREDEWEALLARSAILLRRGDAGPAVADLLQAQAAAAQAGDAYGHAAVARQLARAHAQSGDAAAAAREAARAEKLFADAALRSDPVLEELLNRTV